LKPLRWLLVLTLPHQHLLVHLAVLAQRVLVQQVLELLKAAAYWAVFSAVAVLNFLAKPAVCGLVALEVLVLVALEFLAVQSIGLLQTHWRQLALALQPQKLLAAVSHHLPQQAPQLTLR
jgi:hypothetical protein